MHIPTIFRLLGLLLMLFSPSMLSPLLIAWVFKEPGGMAFTWAFLATFGIGVLLWAFFRQEQRALKIRDGFLLVVLFWVFICSFSALPFIFSLPHESLVDAIFEAASAFTTTGATVLTRLDDLPAALLFYRQQLQFLGGMGIIVLALAILPMLGVGGMQLYQAETPGPIKDNKLAPRIAESAKALWFTYLIMTMACAFCYWIFGMDWFDAIGESFATVSTGGFTMHDTSFAFYQSEAIELVACFFMFLGGTNFALHFISFKKGSLGYYWQDEEFRSYLMYLLLATVLVTTSLVAYGFYEANHHTFIASLFNVVSLATTTGFVSGPLSTWPTFLPWFVLLLAIIGGCGASTSGGIKVIRALLVYKQSLREMERLVHPHAILPIKFGKQVLPSSILQSMWGFISAFIALFWILILCLLACGNDITTAITAVIATLTNSGIGLGKISTNFSELNQISKWILIFAMIAGRLEIFTLLVLFTKRFWQK